MQADSARDADPTVVLELDAAHERAHRSYAARDAAAYMDTFHSGLEYLKRDGTVIGHAQLANDVRSQFTNTYGAASEYHREALEIRSAVEATELLEQRATFRVRAFGVVHREWSVQRRGRYHWLRTAGVWQIRRVEVLSEVVTPARTWLTLK